MGQVGSVASITRTDGEELLVSSGKAFVYSAVEAFPQANSDVALDRLRRGQLTGLAFISPEDPTPHADLAKDFGWWYNRRMET